MATEDAGDDEKKKGIFSQAIDTFYTVPCTRTAYLHGFSSGLVIGLATFLFTSNVRRANNFGVLTFALVVPGSFFYCRTQLEKNKRGTSYATTTYASWKPGDSLDKSSDETSR